MKEKIYLKKEDKKTPLLDLEKIVSIIIETLEKNQVKDIKLINVFEKQCMTDYMIISTGNSRRQISSIAEKVKSIIKSYGVLPLGEEGGGNQSDWVLVDFNTVILHVMTGGARELYDLEGLWEGQ